MPNESNVNNANNYIDSLIQYLSPYVLTGKGTAQAVGRSLSVYSKAIQEHTQMVQDRMTESLNKSIQTEEMLDALLQKANSIEEKIAAYETELLSDDDEHKSTKSKITALLDEINLSKNEIVKFEEELSGTENDVENSIKFIVESNKTKIIDATSTAEESLTDMKSLLDQLKRTHEEVVGTKTADGKIDGGLKAKYEEYIINLEKYDENLKATHAAILDDIKDLLPGATSAGLASSFATQRGRYKKPIKHFGLIFYFVVVVLFIVGLSTLVSWSQETGWSFGWPDKWSGMLAAAFARTPLALPLIWLAYYSSKRRNENRRLEEEYAHKEVIARSYFSFKQQVADLDAEQSSALSAQLLEAAIASVSRNASQTLDKDHDDKLPNIEQLSKLQKTFQSISNLIPRS